MIMLPLKEAKIGSAALLHSQAMIARPLCVAYRQGIIPYSVTGAVPHRPAQL
jgi:hypothetical protein